MIPPWPDPDPARGRPVGKREVATMLGVGPNAVDVMLHRTRRGVAAVAFPEPAGAGQRPKRHEHEHVRRQATPWWWECDINEYAKLTAKGKR